MAKITDMAKDYAVHRVLNGLGEAVKDASPWKLFGMCVLAAAAGYGVWAAWHRFVPAPDDDYEE